MVMVLAVEVGREGEWKILYLKLAADLVVMVIIIILSNVPREMFEVG